MQTYFIYALLALSLAQLAYFTRRERKHDEERKDLYSRLMARDLTEYQHSQRKHCEEPGQIRNVLVEGRRRALNELDGVKEGD